jgi:response regulator RpfG family c-di-GMP phosphodiesterase
MTILIIDDQQPNVTLIEILVQRLGVNFVSFLDPVKALEWCKTHEPDLVMVDYMMPVMNGLDFMQAFRKLPGRAEIPILMVTADSERTVRYKALESGAHDFLNKPIDTTEFLARAKNMLELRESRKHLASRADWLEAEVRKATAEIVGRERESIFRLARVAEYRDPETGLHIVRMAHYCRHLSKQAGFSLADQDIMLAAAPMHDIGKVGIPDAILLKPGKFTDEEMAVMKQHPVIGYEILKDSPSTLHQTAAQISLTHHEKYDGSGYPYGLKGEDIPMVGRIVAICDVLDALVSVRPYKKAWTLEDALIKIKDGSGTHFDPKLVELLDKAMPDISKTREEYAEPSHTAA